MNVSESMYETLCKVLLSKRIMSEATGTGADGIEYAGGCVSHMQVAGVFSFPTAVSASPKIRLFSKPLCVTCYNLLAKDMS
jgi:hypothetical protein